MKKMFSKKNHYESIFDEKSLQKYFRRKIIAKVFSKKNHCESIFEEKSLRKYFQQKIIAQYIFANIFSAK